jgi:hypothetical protein
VPRNKTTHTEANMTFVDLEVADDSVRRQKKYEQQLDT